MRVCSGFEDLVYLKDQGPSDLLMLIVRASPFIKTGPHTNCEPENAKPYTLSAMVQLAAKDPWRLALRAMLLDLHGLMGFHTGVYNRDLQGCLLGVHGLFLV